MNRSREHFKLNTATIFEPRWHSWRPLALRASILPNLGTLAQRYNFTSARERGINDRMNQLIFEKSLDVYENLCTLSDFRAFADMVMDGRHPDYVLAMTKPEVSLAPASSMARRVTKAQAHIHNVTFEELNTDDE